MNNQGVSNPLSRRAAFRVGGGAGLALAGRRLTARAADEAKPPGRIAFIRNGEIWVWQDGDVDRVLKDGAVSDPCWSTGGRQLLFVRAGQSYSDLILLTLKSGEEQRITDNRSYAEEGSPEFVTASNWVLDPDWSAGGLIGYGSDATSDGTMALWLLEDFALGPYLAPIANTVGNLEAVSISPDNAFAAYTIRATEEDGASRTFVAARDLATGAEVVVLDRPNGVYDPAIAPDAQRIAVAARDDAGVSDLWLVDRTSSDATPITSGAQASKPCWAPDGSWLAYLKMVSYKFEIWATPFDGTRFGDPRRIFRHRHIDGDSRLAWTLS